MKSNEKEVHRFFIVLPMNISSSFKIGKNKAQTHEIIYNKGNQRNT